ncbi:MAG: hypothetical protein KDD48_01650 [Bdellovibrionales bacterium]|nr:hypothetical protein [Bdellovibrionales bacterium]
MLYLVPMNLNGIKTGYGIFIVFLLLGGCGQPTKSIPSPVMLTCTSNCYQEGDSLKAPNLSVKMELQNSVVLQWDDPNEGEEGYRLFRKYSDVPSAYSLIAELNPDEMSYEDTSIETGKQYQYVLEVYSGDKMIESNLLLFDTMVVTNSTPAAPSSPNVSFVTQGSNCYAQYSWQDNSDNEEYFEGYIHVTNSTHYIDFSGSPTFEISPTESSGMGFRSNILEVLVAPGFSTRIEFKVRAVNNVGASIYSTTKIVTGGCS